MLYLSFKATEYRGLSFESLNGRINLRNHDFRKYSSETKKAELN